MKRLLTFGLLVLFMSSLLVTSCKKDEEENENPPSTTVDFGTPPSAGIVTTGTVEVITEDNVRYHVIVAVNVCTVTIVETETDVVMIDLGPAFIQNFGTQIKAYADDIGKPISVIITHAHGDHFGNIDKFESSVVYAETSVVSELAANTTFAGLYTGEVTAVESSLTIGGLVFSFDKVSNAETNENAYIYLAAEKALFAEDLIYNQAHNYIREYTPLTAPDELTNWLNGLNELKTQFGGYSHVFVGHNGTRSDISTVIDENIAYLSDAQGLIKGTKQLTAGGFASTNQQVVDELASLYPDYVISALNLSLPDAFYPGDPGADWFAPVEFGDPPPASTITTGTVEVITEDNVRYHVINAVNACTVTIVESATDVVMIDLGPAFIANFGTQIKAYADAIGKPISVIITHAHGDHFGNIDKFASSDVYAETSVVAELAANTTFTGLYTGEVTAVESSLTLGGLVFSFDKVSNAETNENAYIYLAAEKALFAEDLIYNQAHNYIREYTPLTEPDELTNWITGLNGLKTQFGSYSHVFVGHNGTRTDISTVIDENIAYLSDAQGLIKGTKELSSGGFATTNQQVVDELASLYPDYVISALNLSLPDAFYPGDPGAIWFE